MCVYIYIYMYIHYVYAYLPRRALQEVGAEGGGTAEEHEEEEPGAHCPIEWQSFKCAHIHTPLTHTHTHELIHLCGLIHLCRLNHSYNDCPYTHPVLNDCRESVMNQY